jgi:hypothetical protein
MILGLTSWPDFPARLRQPGLVCALVLAGLLAGCTGSRLPAPARETTDTLPILGITNARFWVDRDMDGILREAVLSAQREVAMTPPGPHGVMAPVSFLSISGGSDNGAFGAGLLNGWTESGQRPEFKLVTGVSTGGLTAPFAFLGPAYDARLRAVFTDATQRDIFRKRFLTAALTEDALADTSPLFTLISRYANAEMLADIAREYQKGRLLLIGTTNIDLQRPVLWNIGAIAASGHPGALELFRKILLASASVPAAFPPVLIDVEVDGEHYQEMHVDGGAVAQAFLYPTALRVQAESRRLGVERERTGYLIRNGRIDPEWTNTERTFLTIVGRAVATMIHYSGINDIVRIYMTAVRDGVNFRLAFIPREFQAERQGEFDQAYMRALFDFAYQRARNGYPWLTAPPGLAAPELTAARSPAPATVGALQPAPHAAAAAASSR